MKKTTFRDRLKYRTDEILSRGTASLIMFLAAITLVVIVLAGIAVIIVEKGWAGDSIVYAIWKSFTLSLDAGNLAGVEGSVGLICITALVTLCGIFITSTLIGIINSGLSNRLEELRRGSANILENNHTVILGFNESVFSILSELQIANENKRKACVVLLGQTDKQTMEEYIARRVPQSKATRIICRRGDPASTYDLAHCSIETCKSIIINESDDTQVIRTLLAVGNYLGSDEIRNEYPASQDINIAASINELENVNVARIAGQNFAEVLYFNQFISRIMAHVCYQPGLSSVYLDLFDFSGDEIYVECFPQLGGMTFHDAELAFHKSTIIGIKRNDTFKLNPDPALVLDKNDCLILISSDDGVSHPDEMASEMQYDFIDLGTNRYRMKSAEKLLILGSNSLLFEILNELNVILPKGSKVTLASERNDIIDAVEKSAHILGNLELDIKRTHINNRDILESLLNMGFNHLLVLSDTRLPAEQEDAKTLAILLHIRDLARRHDLQFGITSEMLDIQNQELAQGTNVTDFVISKNIASLIMTQISENRLLAKIFCDLLDSDGSEIYLKPASHYIHTGQKVNLFTVAHAVSLKKEVFIGYKKIITKPDGQISPSIVINPDKRSELCFSDQDWLIVLAED